MDDSNLNAPSSNIDNTPVGKPIEDIIRPTQVTQPDMTPSVKEEIPQDTTSSTDSAPEDTPEDTPEPETLASPPEPTTAAPSTPVMPEEELSSASDGNPQIVDPIKPPKKSHKLLLLLLIVILLAAVGGGAYYFLNHKTATKAASSAAVVKKDIPVINYTTYNDGWESFYPGIDDSSNYSESNVMIFEGLVRFQNKTQIVPLLATGWTNPDSSTWVFNLRKNVTFHTGRAMTAQDVKDSFDAAKNSDFGQISASTITSVTVTGPYQVTIKTDGPDPTLLKKLTNYYVYDTKSGKDNNAINGTGPFVVKPGTTPTPTSLQLVAYDKYWGGRTHVRSFNFIGLDGPDHGKSYGDGKANLMQLSSDQPTATGTRAYKSQLLDETSVFIMALNTLKPGTPLAKLQVRQAIQDALDPLTIAKVRDTDAEPASQVVPNSIPGYNPSLKPVTRDVAKAKQLLTAAGYPKGISFTLTYFTPSQSTGVEIQKELAEAGITVNLDPQSEVKVLAAKAEGGGTDAYFNTQSSDIYDASDTLANYVGTPNYSNPAITALLAKANSTLDATTRLGYLQQATKLLTEDVGVVPVYAEKSDQIIYDPSFVIQRDIADNNLGVYFQNVYAK